MSLRPDLFPVVINYLRAVWDLQVTAELGISQMHIFLPGDAEEYQ